MSSTSETRPFVTSRRAIRARRRKRWSNRLVLYALAVIWVVLLAGPLVWMLSSSLKTQGEVLANPPSLLPEPIRWRNYADVFTQVQFLRYLLNSLLVATVVTGVSLMLDSMAAYSLARLRFPGRQFIFIAIIATMMVPFTVILVPLFVIVDWLGWTNSYLGLIVPMIPRAFGIFLLRQFYLSVPRELEEAAIVDGAGLVKVFWHIVLPLSRPVLAALGIFLFLTNWNNFLWPLIVTQSQELWVVQLGIQQFTGEHTTQYNLIMAASTVAALPTLILFFIFQRRLVEGIKLSGLKA